MNNGKTMLSSFLECSEKKHLNLKMMQKSLVIKELHRFSANGTQLYIV